MALFEHMRPLSDGRPTWLDESHYANIRGASEEIRSRTGLGCWFDVISRRVFFGRTSPDGLIGWLFEHPLFRPDGSRIVFGGMDRDIRVDDVCQIVGYANAPQALKNKWEAQRRWCEESGYRSGQEKALHDKDKLRDIGDQTERFLERLAMGKHYRRTVAMS